MRKFLTTTTFTNDDKFLDVWGDAYWEAICDAMPTGIWFTSIEAAEKLTQLPHNVAQRKRYVALILRNVIAEYAQLDEATRAELGTAVVRKGLKYKL